MLRIEPSAVKPPCFFNQIEEENDTHYQMLLYILLLQHCFTLERI